MLEPYASKRASTVLRGGSGGNAAPLPDQRLHAVGQQAGAEEGHVELLAVVVDAGADVVVALAAEEAGVAELHHLGGAGGVAVPHDLAPGLEGAGVFGQ